MSDFENALNFLPPGDDNDNGVTLCVARYPITIFQYE
jgi:hypothetical protein